MSASEVTAEKARWRERFRAARGAQSPDALAAASVRVAYRLTNLLPTESASGAVALFWPLPGEVDLRPLAGVLERRGTVVALPAVVGDRQLEWRQFEGAQALVSGRWGLREPGPDAAVITAEALAAVVVPGLAFGRDGSRLGYGGGFYDTVLSLTRATRLGVTVESALVGAVPSESHDARMDAIVTENRVWWVAERG